VVTSFAEILSNDDTAARTFLAGISRVNLDQVGTSLFSFVPQE
jgi:hypothetical protein